MALASQIPPAISASDAYELRNPGSSPTPVQIEHALSEEALTAAIMPRYNLFQQVSRVLGTKLGSLKERPESIGRAAA